MAEQTSIAAFNDLKEAKLIGPMQERVLQYIVDHQDKDVTSLVSRSDIEVDLNDVTTSYGPRFAELEAFGLISYRGDKKSAHGNNMVKGWRTTESYTIEGVREAKEAWLLERAKKKYPNKVKKINSFAATKDAVTEALKVERTAIATALKDRAEAAYLAHDAQVWGCLIGLETWVEGRNN
jgi:hypothetical protein